MEVSYLNTYWDVVNFNFHTSSRHWVIRLFFVLYALFFAYIYSTFDVVRNGEHSLIAVLLTYFIMLVPQLLFIAAIGAVGGLLLIPRGPNASYHRHRRIALAEQGVEEDTAVERSQAAWSAVHRVVQNGSYIFIFVTENSAHIVPKKAFATASKADEFFTFAYSHWQAGKRP